MSESIENKTIEFSRKRQLLELLNEALKTINRMGAQYKKMLYPLFVRARDDIERPVSRRDHRVLMLATAKRCIEQAEKMVIAKIIGDDWVPGEDYSLLVHIRSVCFQVKGVLVLSLQEVKEPVYSRKLE